MKNIFFRNLAALFVLVWTASCEDPIDVALDAGTPQLAVDAMIRVNDGQQKVRLTITKAYFDQTQASGATGATVRIQSNLGQDILLTEDPLVPGNYLLDSLKGQTGERFTLRIDYQGETFTAESLLKRGTVIDTLHQEFREAQFGNKEGIFLNLVARDSAGIEDFYWIRYKLNGKENLRTDAISLSADGAFAIGDADGLEFIYPVRNSINLPDGFEINDTIDVELLSIDKENWRFLNEMQTQLNNVGLFAEPIANVRGNVFNTNSSSKTAAVGSFGVARVSKASVVIVEP